MENIPILLVAATLGVSLAAASFAVAITPAAAHECPQEGCVTEGRMTGGGRLATNMIVTHGFELHCDVNDLPNNLQINWGGNRFHLEVLLKGFCVDDPAIDQLFAIVMAMSAELSVRTDDCAAATTPLDRRTAPLKTTIAMVTQRTVFMAALLGPVPALLIMGGAVRIALRMCSRPRSNCSV